MFREPGSPNNVDNQFMVRVKGKKKKYFLPTNQPTEWDDVIFIETPATRYSIKIISAGSGLPGFHFPSCFRRTKPRGLIGLPVRNCRSSVVAPAICFCRFRILRKVAVLNARSNQIISTLCYYYYYYYYIELK